MSDIEKSKRIKNGLISISKLADFTRVTRDTLLHYDHIGLVEPQERGDNNYRYYTIEQIATVSMIRVLRESGLSLKEIQKYRTNRTPHSILELFSRRIEILNEEIESLVKAAKLLENYNRIISEVIDVDEKEIKTEMRGEEKIFLGPPNDYSGGRGVYDALLDFYLYCEEQGREFNLNYAAWGVFSEERLRRGDWVWPDRYYVSDPDAPDTKPAGLYAVGYSRGNYGDTDELYPRILRWIRENGLEICGPAYEEYPLNELCYLDDMNYLIRLMITVRKK